jgi:hypothetical protein
MLHQARYASGVVTIAPAAALLALRNEPAFASSGAIYLPLIQRSAR